MIFAPPSTTITETCSCGATLRASGAYALIAAADWRQNHQWCGTTRRALPAGPEPANDSEE